MQKNQLNHQIADTVGLACWTPCKLCMGKYALGPEQLHINDQHHTVHGIETTSAMHSQPKKLVFDTQTVNSLPHSCPAHPHSHPHPHPSPQGHRPLLLQ